jgi:hypothetical protein
MQAHFDRPLDDLAHGSDNMSGHMATSAVGTLSPSGLGKTINVETANTLKLFQNYFGPYPPKHFLSPVLPATMAKGGRDCSISTGLPFLTRDTASRNRRFQGRR